MKYLTFVNNTNTFNLKNHQVLRLKFRPQNNGNGFTQGGSYRPPPLGLWSDRVKVAIRFA